MRRSVAISSAAARKGWRVRKRLQAARMERSDLMKATRERIVVGDLGPAMLELSEKQRDFVLAYCAFPQASGTDLARMAGYKQSVGSRVWASTASRMLRDPGIIAAIHEVLSKTYRGRGAAIAQDVMLEIAQDQNHPQRLKAAAMLADRGGFAAMLESKVTIEHRDQTSEAMIKRIEMLAKRLGIDAAKLLGGPVIDGRASEVGAVAVAGLRDQSGGQGGEPAAGDCLAGAPLSALGGDRQDEPSDRRS